MTDTDVTFLPNYKNMDRARLYAMILTSPPSLPRSRLWQGWVCDVLLKHNPWFKGCQSSNHLLSNSLSVPG